MKKIGIVTTSRADYYQLSPIIEKLKSNLNFRIELLVTGSHLLESFSNTLKSIAFHIDHIIQGNEEINIIDSKSLNQTLNSIMKSANEVFTTNEFDYVVLLGDRFEVAGIAMVLFNLDIPILHLYGGEVTLGSKDNVYRYLISLMSQYHFVSNKKYKNNLLNYGVDEKKIFEIGYISNDLISQVTFRHSKELFDTFKLSNKLDSNYALISLHPPTSENISVHQQLELIEQILEKYRDILFIATSANNDLGGEQINEWYTKQLSKHSNLFFISNLGFDNYVNLIRSSLFVIGNSSSLVTEVPILNKPSILLGRRQEGRESLGTTIKCSYDFTSVTIAIDRIIHSPNLSNKFVQQFSSADKFESALNSIIKGNSI